LILDESQKKRARLEEVRDHNQDDKVVAEISKKLLGRLGNAAQEEIVALEAERDQTVEEAQIKALADSTGDVHTLQNELNDQLADEEDKIGNNMTDRLQAIRIEKEIA
jgi:hypothetical protein